MAELKESLDVDEFIESTMNLYKSLNINDRRLLLDYELRCEEVRNNTF